MIVPKVKNMEKEAHKADAYIATGQRLDEDIRLLKGSDPKKFTKSLKGLVDKGYAITALNTMTKEIPRIGRVVTYFAELRIMMANSQEKD